MFAKCEVAERPQGTTCRALTATPPKSIDLDGIRERCRECSLEIRTRTIIFHDS
jgi:hypothetical protein